MAAQTDTTKKVPVPFQFADVYFAGQKMISAHGLPVTKATPLVGLTLTKSDFKAYIEQVAGERTANDIDSYASAIFSYLGKKSFNYGADSDFIAPDNGFKDLHTAFSVRSQGKDGGVQITAAQIVDPGKKTESLLLVLLPKVANPTVMRAFKMSNMTDIGQGSYNANYIVTLDLAHLDALAVNGGFKGNRHFLSSAVHFKNVRTTDSDELSWTGRANFTLKSNLSTTAKDLFTGPANKPDRSNATLFSPEITYASVPNPLQSFLFKEQSFYNLDLSGALYDRSDVKDSQISLKYDGVTDLVHVGDAVTIIGFEMDTQQSFTNVSTYYKPRIRLGDRRSNASDYVANADCLNGTYLEFGPDLGYIYYRNVKGIDQTATVGSPQWLVRPALTLGWKGQSLFGATLDGTINSYYLQKWGAGISSGGQVSSSVVEVLDAKFTFGPKNQQLTFQIQAGANPANGFKQKQTTYALGVAVKF